MTALIDRKTRLKFEVSTEIYAPGTRTVTHEDGSKSKQRFTRRTLIVECDAYAATMRLKGTQQRLPIDWESVYVLAAKKQAAKVLADKPKNKKQAAKKAAKKKK